MVAPALDTVTSTSRVPTYARTAIGRLSGSLVSTFGSGGQVVKNFATPIAGPIALTVRSNGSVLGAVQARAESANLGAGVYGFQMLPDGSPDPSIGAGGTSLRYAGGTKPAPGSAYVGFGTNADGRIMTAFNATTSGVGVVKVSSAALIGLGSDAKLDTGFGTSGTVSLSGGPVSDVDRTPDGRIFVVQNPNVLAFLKTGAADLGFAAGGRASASFKSTTAHFARAAIQKDGRLVVLGTWKDETTNESDLLLSRYWN